MINRIVISESQYSRLFLNEQQPILLGVNKEFDSYGKYNIVNQNPILTEQLDWWGKLKAEFGISPGTQFKNGVVAVAKKLHPDTAVPELEKGIEEVYKKFDVNTINDLGKGTGELAKEVYNEIISPTYEYVKDVDLQKSAVEFSNWLEKNVGRSIDDFGEYLSDTFKDAYYVLGRDLKLGRLEKQAKDALNYFIQQSNSGYGAQEVVDGVKELSGKFDEKTADKLLGGLVELGPKIQNEFDILGKQLYEYRHEIIDVLSVAALFIPIPGVNVVLSMALEGINGGLYLAEGDELSGYLSFGFMFIPGVGPLYRRLTQKSIRKVMKIIKFSEGLSKSKGAKAATDYLVEKGGKLTANELELLHKSLKAMEAQKTTVGNMSKKQFRDKAKKDQKEWYDEYKNVELGFGKGSRFLHELMNPTLLEKYIYAGSIATMITLDKTGAISSAADVVVKGLISAGLMDKNITEEEVDQIGENIIKSLEEHMVNYGTSDMDYKSQEDMLLNIDNMVKTTISVLDTVPKIPSRLEVLKLPIDKQKEVVNNLQKKGISSDMELRNFNVFKWAELCKGKNKLSIDVEIDEEKESWLNDRTFNYRYIKSPELGSDFEYASDEDGLWYYKKGEGVKWKLVSDCNSLLKIETELEKLNDKDIDTEGEVSDIIKTYH
tara:strand:+ start:2431 stop:4410 length:1980 start_codon:yes stop_codon:yes gene_type:complete